MASNPDATAAPDAARLMAELQFLTELSLVVASNTELDPILDWVVHKTTDMFRADEGSIKLLTEPAESQSTVKTLISRREPGRVAGSWPPSVAMNVMGYLMAKNEPLATSDLVDDARFPSLRGMDTRLRATLAVPLKVGNRFTGMLAITHNAPGRQWVQDEIQLLTIVAANSAGVIEQARLRSEAQSRQRLEEEAVKRQRELDLARQIQMSLVPSRPLRVGSWEAVGRIVPAQEVGGDAFDYFLLGSARIGVAIADVAGKGVPAALLMSNVQASLRAFCDGRNRIADAMRSINESVVRSSSSGRFITFFYAEIDLERGRMFYSNAGHNYPLLRRRDGTLIELAHGGFPLGIVENATFETGEQAFAAGDALLLYSDGVPDALNERMDDFGDDRLKRFWQSRDAHLPSLSIEALMAEVQAFRGRAVQNDDMTIVVVGEHGAS